MQLTPHIWGLREWISPQGLTWSRVNNRFPVLEPFPSLIKEARQGLDHRTVRGYIHQVDTGFFGQIQQICRLPLALLSPPFSHCLAATVDHYYLSCFRVSDVDQAQFGKLCLRRVGQTDNCKIMSFGRQRQ